jgi:hypothetical protein
MRLYGNLTNRISEHRTNPAPTVGMGATIYAWSDRYPATVRAVSPSGKTVELTEDRVTSWKRHYGTGFEADPTGRAWTARKAKNGTWKTLKSGNGVSLGERAAYHDPSF